MELFVLPLAAIFVAFISFRMILFFAGFYGKEKKNGFFRFFSTIASLLILFILSSIVIGIFKDRPFEDAAFFILMFLLYVFVCSSLKVIITFVVHRKMPSNANPDNCNHHGDENCSFTHAFLFKLEYILISPDYCFTHLCKTHDYYDGGTKKSRSELIKAYNISNIIISLAVASLLIFFNKYLPNFIVTKMILMFAGIRFVSRSIEIIISFVKDVIDKKKSSIWGCGCFFGLCLMII